MVCYQIPIWIHRHPKSQARLVMDAVRITDCYDHPHFINLAHVCYIQEIKGIDGVSNKEVQIAMSNNHYIKIEDMTLDEVLIKLGLDHL